jgi:hypothetical protein
MYTRPIHIHSGHLCIFIAQDQDILLFPNSRKGRKSKSLSPTWPHALPNALVFNFLAYAM